MKALVITPAVMFRLSQFSLSEEWFDKFGIPENEKNIKRIVINDIVYLIDANIDTYDNPVVVINLGVEGIFSDKSTCVAIMERIITTTRSIYTDSVSIPTGWKKHSEGTVFSIQATRRSLGWKTRLHFEARPSGSKDLFVFSRTDDTVDFFKLDRHLDIYNAAKESFLEAIFAPFKSISNETRAGIILSERLPQGFVQGATLEQWYDTKLTNEQRSFVDKPHDGPVRLRGAAGTGKTLSLVIKFLRDAQKAQNGESSIKFGFLTHSTASVDLINSIGESLDSAGLLYGSDKNVTLEVRTLYDLAHKNLNFELDHLEPLSLDGREGRRLQAELIELALKEIAASDIDRARFQGISSDIQVRWKDVLTSENTKLVSDIMNEFASVLDAEGIRAGEEKGERYVRGGARPSWLMLLPTELDRRFILEIHRRYRRLLGEMNTLSVDQMIGDFNSFLESNRWDRIRGREGYDVLFVDELHLFTSVERQTLHKLIKHNVEEDGRPRRPPIFMAYDLKQSPRDTFATYGEGDRNLFTAATGLQGADLVKLERVFRYTPQIAEFLTDLDATFPAIDIPGEWDAYSGQADIKSGDVPQLTVFATDVDLFKNVFTEAHKIARVMKGGGRRVAVLCASEELFDKYVVAAGGQFEGKIFPITSREPSSELRHAGKRFIFSMPEYVAGLQFDTVFLIHVDASEAPIGSGDGIRRRFISNIYLGASRTEKTLRISATLSRGGKSDVLDMALARGSLREVYP